MFRKILSFVSCIIGVSGSFATTPQTQLSQKGGEGDFKSSQMSPGGEHPMARIVLQNGVTNLVGEPCLHYPEIEKTFNDKLCTVLSLQKFSLVFDGKDYKVAIDPDCISSFTEAVSNILDLCRKESEMLEFCQANARVTALAQDIGNLKLADINLKISILEKMNEFIKYYEGSSPGIQSVIKDNQDLIDCLGVIACRIDVNTEEPQDLFLPRFFKKITDFPMTKQNGKTILEKSEGEMAYNFKTSGGLDDIT